MNYNEFLEYAAKNIRDYLPPEYSAADVRLDTVNKMSEQYTGLTVRIEEETAVPVVNMKFFYEQYEATGSLEQTMQDMAKILQTEKPEIMPIETLQDYEQLRDSLFIRLSSPEGNSEIMADSPYRFESDLLMTYHVYMPTPDQEFMSARVTNQMMESLGVTEEQLHADAIASTEQVLKPKIQSMMEALTGIPEENPQMLVVTSEQGTLGAGVLFCEGVMDKVAEQMKGNYFILPSSIHETLVIPDNGDFKREDLEKMVREANQTVVAPHERLSDAVYHYDSKDHIFESNQGRLSHHEVQS